MMDCAGGTGSQRHCGHADRIRCVDDNHEVVFTEREVIRFKFAADAFDRRFYRLAPRGATGFQQTLSTFDGIRATDEIFRHGYALPKRDEVAAMADVNLRLLKRLYACGLPTLRESRWSSRKRTRR